MHTLGWPPTSAGHEPAVNRRNYMTFRLRHTPLKAAVLLALATGIIGAAGAANTTRVIVTFKPGAAAAVKAATSAARGAVVHEIYGMDAIAIEVPPQAL